MAGKLLLIVIFCVLNVFNCCNCEPEDNFSGQQETKNRFRLEGKITVPTTADKEWTTLARVLVDGGQFLGFVKPDGTFSISSIPSGSYIVEVNHPTYVFDPTRVEVSSKGKVRARTLNNIQPSALHAVNYPLKFKARGQAQYFEKREQWRLTDLMLNPMILMMVLPLGLMVLLPKLINSQDPDVQREMQQMSMLQPQQNMPDVTELMMKWFGGGSDNKNSNKKKEIKSKPSKKQQ